MQGCHVSLSGAGRGVSYGTSPGPFPQMCSRLLAPSARVGFISRQHSGCGLAGVKWTEALPPGLRVPLIRRQP